ncbi:hypothetical protein PINS_up020733 [Pythium insidiosum]|nr:hypothetical protein PINS_up020733 [Pythium insidiosum]
MDPPSAMILVSQYAIKANSVISEWTKTERDCTSTQKRAELRLLSLETMPRHFHLDPNVQALEAQLKKQIDELKAFSEMNAVKKPFHISNAQETEEQTELTMQQLLHEVIMCSIKESDVTGRTSEEYNRLSQFSRQPDEVSRSSTDDPTLADCALDALQALADALEFANRDTACDLVSKLSLLLCNGSTHAKVGASVVLCKMASNPSVRQIVLGSDAPCFLLNLVTETTPAEREHALQALLYLAPDIQSNLIDPDFLARVVKVLGNTVARHKKETAAGAGIISVLARNPDHHERLQNANVIEPIKRLVEWDDNEMGQVHAISALDELVNSRWLRNVIADERFLRVMVQQVYHLNCTVRKDAGALLLRLASADESRACFICVTHELISLIESRTDEHRETALRILEEAAHDQNIAGKISNNSKALRQLFVLLATGEHAVLRVSAANILLALVHAEICGDQITSHAMPSLLDMLASTKPEERGAALGIVLRLTRSADARSKLSDAANWISTLQEIQRTGDETHRRSATEILKRLGPTSRARSSLFYVAGETNDPLKLSWRDVLCGCFSHRAKSNAARDQHQDDDDDDGKAGSIASTHQIAVTPTSDFHEL